MNDGNLDVLLFQTKNRLKWIKFLYHLIKNKNKKIKEISLKKAKKIIVNTPVSVHIDAEYIGDIKTEIKIKNNGLSIFV